LFDQMLDSFYEAGRWLNGTDLHNSIHRLLQTVGWVSPTIQSIHIVSVAVVIGTAALLDMRILGWAAPSQVPAEMARRLLPWTWIAITLQFFTGAMLIINRPARYADNTTFLAKMVFLIIGVVLTLVLAGGLRRDPDHWTATPARRVTAKAMAFIALVAWVLVVLAGRWIAYR
jgi:hypothetical protein